MLIYKITNLINDKVYIGRTIGVLKRRMAAHCAPSSGCLYLSLAIKKYGKENFKVEELAKASSVTELNALEAFFINEFNCIAPKGYNLRAGGDGGGSCSAETKRRMSDAKRGILHPFYGKHHSEDSINKIKISKKGCFRKVGTAGKRVERVCPKTGEIKLYPSLHQTKYEGFSFGCVRDCCVGKRKTHKGYIWRYLNV